MSPLLVTVLIVGGALADYYRFPLPTEGSFTLNGYTALFFNWTGPGYSQRGRDWPGLCSTGQSQSPIDIVELESEVVSSRNSTFSTVELDTKAEDVAVFFDGYFDINYVYAGTWRQRINGVVTERVLVDVLFKTPSEHTINGIRYPMNIQISFASALPTGSAQMSHELHISVQAGRSNPALQQYLRQEPMDVSHFFPASHTLDDYFYYEGSFPQPPCGETVPWFVSNYVVEAAEEEIEYFRGRFVGNREFAGGAGNVRGIQPRNGRKVYHFVGEV